MRILIEGGRVIDPANDVDAVLDLLIEDGRIAEVRKPGAQAQGGRPTSPADRVLAARGKVVCPGFVDLHVHLREPGREDMETIATGTRAAARGGFTSVCAMPNTSPVNDNQSVTDFILDRARRDGAVHVFPVGAISKGQQGEELAEIGELVGAGCVAISDDGKPVMNAELMRRALEYASMFRIPVIQHAEDLHMTGKGVMHEGLVSTELGMRGIPAASEAIIVARDILLAELTGSHYHVAHISTEEAVRLVREAKAKGLRVTCEVAPHHFALTDEAVYSFSTNTKMSPPLRSARHVAAVKAGLHDGTIDAIATDHAPHTIQDKEVEFDYAANGIVGLETAFGLSVTVLVEGEILTLNQVIARLTCDPARIFRLAKGTLAVGADADVTIVDPNREWLVDVKRFASKSKNSPFDGWKLRGQVLCTIVGGKVVWELEG
ncbi:MAG TPA: dihydroorotase [Candidatus Methylomirabilis sp.]|nr:dihydroorotase [Candidatus Methylomirabilis sp.]